MALSNVLLFLIILWVVELSWVGVLLVSPEVTRVAVAPFQLHWASLACPELCY